MTAMDFLRRALGVVTAAGFLAASTSAAADPTTVVTEVYEGERPPDADRLVGPVLDELRAHGAAAGAVAVGGAYERARSRPGIAAPAARVERLAELSSRGYEEWTQAHFAQAIKLLEQAVTTAQAAPTALVLQDALRRAYRQALVGLALSHKRLGHQQAAEATIAELVRSFPDAPLQAVEFGLEAFRLYGGVKASLDELGQGSLSIEIDDRDAVVFVDEQYVANAGRGKILIPGRYRVLVRKSDTVGRVYAATIEAGKTTVLDVSWARDQMLHTSPDWAGLVFPDTASRKRFLAAYVLAFARAVGASTIIAVGLGREETRRSVIGKVFSLDSAGPGRTASVAVAPVEPSEEHLRALGAYLAGATAVPPPRDPAPPGELVVMREEAEPPRDVGPPAVWWSAMAGGALAAGTGSYLLAIDGRPTCDAAFDQCRHIYRTSALGIATISVGAAAIGTSAFLLWRSRRRGEGATHGVALTLGAARGIALVGAF